MRAACLTAAVVTGLLLGACGGNDDDQAGTGQAKEPTGQEAPNAAAAERLETYLRKNTKDINTRQGSDQTISHVEAAGGELKIWTFFNAEIPSEAEKAGKVCRLATESGVSGIKGAVVVDAGNVEIRRC